ncbi:MAG: hypothetical protein GF417_03420 [Candidatus Latescibacteria bacterium]|nr:hypothetical protein [bacterium]MBD3423478.1 hypothetical protein [Candidatus Latescibacterota bacterium]
METEKRIYLLDPYCSEFSAMVTGSEQVSESQSMVYLDRTSFYPESGGQPSDTGTLSGRKVTEVRETDRGVGHLVEGSLSVGDKVEGVIDFKRRFDHMQQHTGQHILSRVFLDLAHLSTAGFHMGERASTIDLQGKAPSAEIIRQAELRANRLIYRNLPVNTSEVSREEFEGIGRRYGYQPRSEPPPAAGSIRLVEVEGVDINACCGTHTQRTGEIGIIKITGTERVRKNTRIEFLCGYRALADYLDKSRILSETASVFSTSHTGLVEMVEKVSAENIDLKKKVRSLKEEIASSRAQALDAGGEIAGHSMVNRELKDVEPALLGKMAGEMREDGVEIILLGVGGDKPALVFACSPGLDLDMSEILKEAAEVMGARGGGSGDFARGGGGDPSRLKETLQRGEELVRKRLD